MPGLIRFFLIISISLMLHACGGGAETPWDSTTDGVDGGGDGGDGGGDTTAYYLGSGTGASFVSGTLDVGVTSLSAGGTTSVSATIADTSGTLLLDSSTVTFTSSCVASGLATITSPISTTTGVATTTYSATGCSGSDTITATATLNGSTRTATGSLTVQPAVIGSMQFVSATPPNIGISGFGLVEVSEVSFLVKDQNGNPVSGQLVDFALSTNVGGAHLSSTSDTSDASGIVRADVNSGTVPTTVRVTATLNSDPTINTQSDGLIISTGVADQDSMSLSATDLNPEALGFDGVVVGINVYAADHFNNPVPDGTAVSFTTEGGQIQSQCQTVGGGCSVNWISSNPRPADGRVTILATMLGEESFNDVNGNGALDAADTFVPYGSDDMPEAFRDDDWSRVHELGEEFVDFDRDTTYSGADGLYNGALCCSSTSTDPNSPCYDQLVTATTLCSTETNIHVRDDLEIVMSGSTPFISFSPASLDVSGGGLASTTLTVTDVNGQTLPENTSITISTGNGTLQSPGSFTIGDTNAFPPPSYNITVSPDGTHSAGLLTVKVKTPKGSETVATITVTD